MNKIIGAVSSIVLAFYTEAISIECYRKYVEVRTSDKNGGGIQYQNQFSPSTDPIRGKILFESQILDRFRFCGDIDFFSKVTRKLSVVGNVLSRANSESENALSKKAPEEEMNRDDGKACSFSNKSKNAMTELLIYLFPAAGPSLNAQGAGALDKDIYDIVDIIVGMFKIARDVRQGGKDHEIFKEINAVKAEEGKRPARKSFLNKYFNLYKDRSNDEQTPQTKSVSESGEMSQGILLNSKQGKSENELLKEAKRKEKLAKREMQKNAQLKTPLSSSSESSEAKKINNSTANMLVELAKSVANAVLLEEPEDGKDAGEYDSAQLFSRYFVNDLICAYVWAALPDRRLGDLLDRLATANIKDALDTTYKSHLGEDVIKNEGHIVSLVPFRPGQYITKHAIAHYDGSGFPDCVETMIRQFLTTLFSSYEKGDDGGRLYLDVKRVPAGSKLRHFFEQNNDVRCVANDGSREVRDAWAEVVSGLSIEKVYRNETHIIAGGWDNSIKVICALMEGYSAADSPQEGESLEVWERKKNAAIRIKDVNTAVRNGTFNISAKKMLNVINDLLGIRTDVKLIAKEEVDNDLLNGGGCVEGGLVIYPEGHEECNSLYFGNYDNHAELSSIPRFKAIKRDDVPPASSFFWIEKLYYDEDFAINGEKTKGLLSEARYPTFEYYRRLLKEYQAYYISAISEKINEEAYIEGIARSFYGNNCEFELSNVINKMLQADAFLENIVKFVLL